MVSTPKIAVIGAGNWGKNLVSNLHQLGVLTAVADASPELRSGLGEIYPELQLHASVGDLLANGEVDAVAIATPAHTHHAVAMECLHAGKDVFCEKPLTLSSREAGELCDFAESKDRILMVGHLLLYQPAVRWLRNYIGSGKLGRIYSLHQERKKLGRARVHENALWSLGVHDVAVLLDLVGESPCDVSASGCAGLQRGIEDDVYCHLTFPSGVIAHVHNSWLWPEDRRRLTVVAEKGMLVYEEKDQTVTLHRKTIGADLQNCDGGEEVLFEGSAQPLRLEMEHFVECIRTRQRPLSDGRSGLAVVEVMELAAKYF